MKGPELTLELEGKQKVCEDCVSFSVAHHSVGSAEHRRLPCVGGRGEEYWRDCDKAPRILLFSKSLQFGSREAYSKKMVSEQSGGKCTQKVF